MTLADGCTMLHLAALRLDAAAIRTAARAGDDPNGRDTHGRSPLCLALGRIDAGLVHFRNTWTNAVLALLEAGADLDAPRYTGGKPLREHLPTWLRERVNAFECHRALRGMLAVPVSSEGRVRL